MKLRLSAIVFCGLVPALAWADAAVRWHCAYAPAEGEVLLCELDPAPLEGRVAQPRPAGMSRLPQLVSDILVAPETLEGETIAIPLNAAPTDLAKVGVLAKDVMCGKRTDCEVQVTANRLARGDASGAASMRAASVPRSMTASRRGR